MTSNIKENQLYHDFKLAEAMLRALFEDRDPPGVLLYGPPGVGKTHIVRRLHREYFNHEIEPMGGSARGLMDYIFEHRDDVLVFDDVDKLFYDPAMMALFKTLLDTNPPRIIAHRVKGENYLPPFEVTAAVVVLTNRDLDDPSNFGKSFYREYIMPFKSRVSASSLKMSNDPRDLLDYTLHLAPEILSNVGLVKRASGLHRKLIETHRNEIFDHFIKNFQFYPEISPRMIHNLGKARLNFPDDLLWIQRRQKLLDNTHRQRKQEEAEFERIKRAAERGALPPGHPVALRPITN